MAKIKFHLDEHVAEAIATGLRRRGHDVTTTAQAELISASDLQQLEHCRREGRVMVSNDTDMLRLASAGVQHAGVAYRHPARGEVGLMVRLLVALANRSSAEEMINRVEFL